MPINTSNLRKNNWVCTEYGIVRVAYVIWSDVYVYLHDGRTNYASDVEGIGIGELDIISKVGETLVSEVLRTWLYVHEMQNYFYWKTGKELKIEL
jgi:hypothetical protein